MLRVIDSYCIFHPQLQTEVRRVAQDLILKKKSECEKHVREIIEMEKLVDFTLSPSYIGEYGRLLKFKAQFMERLRYVSRKGYGATVELDGIDVDVSELTDVPSERVGEAYDMQMSIMAYWKVVTLRMGDGIPLRLQFVCSKLVMTEFTSEVLTQVGSTRFGSMEEIPEVANKRRSLTSSIGLLTESRTTVESIMDRIAKD